MKCRRARERRALLAFLILLAAVYAAPICGAQTPVFAPVNPDFEDYLKQSTSGRIQSYDMDGYALGAVPPPVDLSHMKNEAVPGLQVLALPASYDLRAVGKLTAVRNQGNCGSCWSFGTYSSLESCLMPGEVWNFSENNLKNLSGFDVPCCDGGNHYMSTAYLARWDGPVNESSDPYNDSSCTSPTGLPAQKHVQQVLFLPNRSSSTDNAVIKQAVMDHGAVYTHMYWASSSYNSSYAAYYYSGTSAINHAVCIVGWDDNFDKSRFPTAPPANGAFIIRNSWGTSWGQSGYFYISYYDSKIGRDNAVFCGNSPTDNYDRIYQYDPLGWVSSLGYNNETGWFANVFTSAQHGEIAAYSFYAGAPGAAYEAYVYLSPNSGPINTTAGWSAFQAGTLTFGGYHTVTFDTPVTVAAGQKFSVVVKMTTPGYKYPIPFETPAGGYSSEATASPGQSYISSRGTSWTDLTSSYTNANVCLKGFVNDVEPAISIGAAKLLPNGTTAALEGAVVTGVFTATFYVEADDRSTGIAVYKSGHTLAPGMRADVLGTLSTNASGEKYINAVSAAQNGTGYVEPVILPNSLVGGADWEYDPVTGTGQKGVKDAISLNNIGALICTTGTVTYVGSGYFYMDDGSRCRDNTTYVGVKVSTSTGMTLPQVGKYVKVVGISSCSKSGVDLYRLLRATSITVMN